MSLSACVICAEGIGDGLLMMTLANQFRLSGYTVTVCNPFLKELKDWLPNFILISKEELFSLKENLFSFDFVVFQNDNSPFEKQLLSQREKFLNFAVFYASYNPLKHFPFKSLDFIADRSLSFVQNLKIWGQKLFQNSSEKIEICPPKHLQYQKYENRIAIHPTSRKVFGSWEKKKFLSLIHILKKKNFQIVLTVSANEYPNWAALEEESFLKVPLLNDLNDFAKVVYESKFFIGNDSGIGHLASMLSIPTLTIGGRRKELLFWRPGFYLGEIVTPPAWIPNFKTCRWRENFWQKFISVKQVLKTFDVLKKSQLTITKNVINK